MNFEFSRSQSRRNHLYFKLQAVIGSFSPLDRPAQYSCQSKIYILQDVQSSHIQPLSQCSTIQIPIPYNQNPAETLTELWSHWRRFSLCRGRPLCLMSSPPPPPDTMSSCSHRVGSRVSPRVSPANAPPTVTENRKKSFWCWGRIMRT